MKFRCTPVRPLRGRAKGDPLKSTPLEKQIAFPHESLTCDENSFITPKEAMAAGELGCHSATISHTVLDQLAKLKYDRAEQPGEGTTPKPAPYYEHAGPTPERLRKLAGVDPLAAADWDGKLASTDIDYLANGGEKLEEAIRRDPVSVTRLKDALELFIGGEERSKAKVEAVLAKL